MELCARARIARARGDGARRGQGRRHRRRDDPAEEPSRACPSRRSPGKIVIDTNNYYPSRDGHIPAPWTTSPRPRRSSCRRTCRIPKVVKAFNHIYAPPLTAHGLPAGAPNRRALLHRRRRPGGQGHGDQAPRSVRVRHGGRRPPRGGLANPARHPWLRPAAQRAEEGCAVTWRRPDATRIDDRLGSACSSASLEVRLSAGASHDQSRDARRDRRPPSGGEGRRPPAP